MNNFDLWNEQKKNMNKSNKIIFCKEREIWWCNLGLNIGHEENGKGQNFRRPVLILKKFGAHNLLVIPLTTSNKINRFKINIGSITNKKSCVIISQIRVVDIKRLADKIVILPKENFNKIKKVVRENL